MNELEAFLPSKRKVNVCEYCGGTGETPEDVRCPNCYGTGRALNRKRKGEERGLVFTLMVRV